MSEVMGSQTHPSTNDLNLFFKGKGWNPTSTSHSTQSLNLFLTVRGGVPHRPATALKKPAHRPFYRRRRNIFQKGSEPRYPPAVSCRMLRTEEIVPATFILIISS